MKLASFRTSTATFLAVLVLGSSAPAVVAAQTPNLESLRAQLEAMTRSLELLRTTAPAPNAVLTQAAAVKPVVPVRPTCRVALDKTVYTLGEKVKITVGATAATRVEFIDGVEQIQGQGKTLPSLGKNGGTVTLAGAKTLTDEEGYEYGARGAVVRVRATSVTGHTAECSKALTFVYEDATKKDLRLEALWVKVNEMYRALDALEERRMAMNDQENKIHTALESLYTQMRELRKQGNVSLVGLDLDLVEQSTSSALFEFEFLFENRTRKPVGFNEASFDLVAINRQAGNVTEGTITVESVEFAGGETGAVVNPGMQEEVTVLARYTPRAGRQGQFTLWIDDIMYYTDPPKNQNDVEVAWEFDGIETPYAIFRSASVPTPVISVTAAPVEVRSGSRLEVTYSVDPVPPQGAIQARIVNLDGQDYTMISPHRLTQAKGQKIDLAVARTSMPKSGTWFFTPSFAPTLLPIEGPLIIEVLDKNGKVVASKDTALSIIK